MNRYARIEISPTLASQINATTLCQAAHHLGLTRVTAIHPARLFFLTHPDLQADQVEQLCRQVLTDTVVESYNWQWVETGHALSLRLASTVEVEFLPGVTDRVAFEVTQAAHRLELPALQVRTGHRYHIEGALTEAELHRLARQVLGNEVVQRYEIGLITPHFMEAMPSDGRVELINLADLSDDDLVKLSQTRRLALNMAVMQVLRNFSQEQHRPLTDAELEMAAQTWSEHCYHKTFRAKITYTELDSQQQPLKTEIIDGLLKTTIRAATEACSKKWIVSAFVDNAGIMAFDDTHVISFKVETHNHPSALEPFGGSNTGVGGVIRDVIGVSARPIAVTDVLCFGPQNLAAENVPAGSLHPRQVQAGVVAGVGDYGNKMGIPTVNGAVLYHPGYIANPLVYCGCVGFAPIGSHVTNPQIGDRLIVLGGRTGRDGLRGATFSSLDLDSGTSEASFASTAVQIGDPIIEKDVMEVIMVARDAQLYNAITDCGAGGLSSAIGEMGQTLGADVELTQVGLKYSGLRPWEIWLSEAQERMVLAVSAAKLPELMALCQRFEVPCDNVGHLTGDGQMVVRYQGEIVVNLPMSLLHDGHPRLELTATWSGAPHHQTNSITSKLDHINPTAALLTLLADPNVASKEAIIRTYDHEVQGGTVVKPLTGIDNHGPSDAAVIKPVIWQSPLTRASSPNGSPLTPAPLPMGEGGGGEGNMKGIAISNGINPWYGLLDPYLMAVSVVDEAIRNAVAVGADPDQLALLDNFCWGNPNLPDRLGGLVRAAQGCYDAARAFDVPFISGKDSLNNEYVGQDGQRTPIPGTLLISAMAIVPDVRQAVTMDVKQAGNFIYIVGETGNHLGGSLLARHYDLAADLPPTLPHQALATARALHQAIQQGLVRACHDLSEGGLAVAAAEMALAGGLGMEIDLAYIPAVTNHAMMTMFSESNGRWLVEVTSDNAITFETTMHGCVVARCGEVTAEAILKIDSIEVTVRELMSAWRG